MYKSARSHVHVDIERRCYVRSGHTAPCNVFIADKFAGWDIPACQLASFIAPKEPNFVSIGRSQSNNSKDKYSSIQQIDNAIAGTVCSDSEPFILAEVIGQPITETKREQRSTRRQRNDGHSSASMP